MRRWTNVLFAFMVVAVVGLLAFTSVGALVKVDRLARHLEERIAEEQRDVTEHRIVSRCAFHDIQDALLRIANRAGISLRGTRPPPTIEGIEAWCRNLPPISDVPTPSPPSPGGEE